MAVDIGPKIGIDGEAEFRKQINNLTQQVKTFGSEMQVLSSDFDTNENKVESLTKKNETLTKSITAQQQKIELLQRGLKASAEEYGDNDTKTLKWQQAVNKATADLNKMKAELKQNEAAMDNLGNETDDLKDSLDSAGGSASSFGSIFSASLAADFVTNTLSGIVDGLKQVTEESREYRKVMGSLGISSEKAGYTAEETAAAYETLYGVLGDNQTAATTTANLQALGLKQEELDKIVKGSIGAWATYGDSIPIDGLAESINETVKAGQVTGTFADVLNWAGTSEDDFNAKLASCSDASERANLVLQEMADQGLIAAGEGWQSQNQSLVAANQATAEYEARIGALGETVEPIFTLMQNGLNQILGLVLSLLQYVDLEAIVAQIIEITDFFGGLVTGVQSGSITIQEAFAEILARLNEILQSALGYFSSALPEILSLGLEMVGSLIQGLLNGLPELISTVGQLVIGFLDGILNGLPQILDSGAQMLSNLIQGIVDNLPEIVVSAFKVITEFRATILEHLPEILESGIKLLGELIAGIIRAIPDLIAAIPQVISGIKDTLLSYDWLQIGKDILKGLANGILGGVGEVIDAVKDAAGRIANAFTDFFDIHSPSKWAEDEIAGNIMKGFPAGFQKYESAAVKAAESAAQEIAGAFPSQMDIPVESNGTIKAYERMSEEIKNLKIYLDGKTLVGAIAPRMNTSLGGYAKKEGRFGT